MDCRDTDEKKIRANTVLDYSSSLFLYRSFNIVTSERVWIIPGSVLDYIMSLSDPDLASLMEGVIVVKEQEGQGPVYAEVVRRWKDPAVQARYICSLIKKSIVDQLTRIW